MLNRPTTTPRRGAIVHEASVAVILAGAIIACVAQLLTFSAQQTRARTQRLTAVREAANLMEQLMARSWDDLTADHIAETRLSENCHSALPGSNLDVVLTDDEGAKRVHLTITWQHASGNREAPVQLVAWKYPRGKVEQ